MPTYKNYAIIADKRRVTDFDAQIDYYMGKSNVGEDVTITEAFPERIVTKSAENNYFNIPNIRYYQLTKEEAIALESTSSIKEVARHYSEEETLLKIPSGSSFRYIPLNEYRITSISESLNLTLKSGSQLFDFYSLTRAEDYDDPEFTGSITSSRLPLNAPFYSASQNAFWYNGGEEIFTNSSSYSQSFLDTFIEASMSWDNTKKDKYPDGDDYIGLQLNGLITPWYLENEPALDDINDVLTPFGGGGLGFYNITPTVNQRWRTSETVDNNAGYYAGDWPGSIIDNRGQMTNWGLYAHATPKEEFDWRIMYQLDTDSSSMDEYGNFPLKSTSVHYNFTATGKNVDLIIMDTGVNNGHPEFSYYDPNSGSGQWVSRVQRTDWSLYAPGATASYWYNPSSGSFVDQYYTNMNFEHGTSVASNAAGRTQGWAKEARIHDLKVLYCENPIPINTAFEAILNFHVSKSINPETGFKDPTVVNMSWSHTVHPIDISQWYDSDGKLFSWSEASDIRKIYYKGVDIYPDYSGSEDRDGNFHWNLMPGHDQGIRFKFSESFDSSLYGGGSHRKIFDVWTSAYNGVAEELITQASEAGVIFVAAAQNNASLAVRSGSKYEGVDYDHRGLWDSYFVKTPGTFNSSSTEGTAYYMNRATSPARNNTVISVGSISPHIVINKGTDLLTGSLKTSGSYAYDIFGIKSGCPWVYGGDGSIRFIKNTADDHYSIPEFEHSDMHQVMGTNNRSAKRGIGVGDNFPGWVGLNTASYFQPSFFSNTGNAIDIWAAGYQVAVARADLDQIIAEVSGFGWRPTKHVSRSIAHFEYPYQPDYYFLGNTEYSNYYNLYPDTSPPLRVTQQVYRVQAGTSFAAPNVAGVVCLFKELNPGANWSQVKKFLIEQGQKAMPVWNDNPSQNYADFTGSMKSEFALASGNYGGGKITPIVSDDSIAPTMNRDIAICGAEPVMLY